jgi:hypothetical protein
MRTVVDQAFALFTIIMKYKALIIAAYTKSVNETHLKLVKTTYSLQYIQLDHLNVYFKTMEYSIYVQSEA